MKKLLTLTCVIFASIAAIAQTKVSILGDSYSTFEGYMSPSTNLSWYNNPDNKSAAENDVKDVEQTWWKQLIKDTDMELERNNSYSGATVCTTGYRKEDFSDRAFIFRLGNLGNPDIIIVLSGTNDSWAKSPIGDFKYEGWTKEDLSQFRPAFAYMMHQLKALYPKARIINVVNSELSEDVTSSQAKICELYGITNVQLENIDKQKGHPSQAGMKAIADQIKPHL